MEIRNTLADSHPEGGHFHLVEEIKKKTLAPAVLNLDLTQMNLFLPLL